MMFACIAVLLLSAGTMMTFKKQGESTAEPGKIEDKQVTVFDADTKDMEMDDNTRTVLGSAMFVFFVVIGIVIPFSKGRKMNVA